MGKLFTSESVTEGHPDKIADQISDAILDALLEQDPYSRVAAETTVATGIALVVGEITTKAYVDIAKIARDTIREIGYVNNVDGYNANSIAVLTSIDEQSADIALGVDQAFESKQDGATEDFGTGAGDQGIIFGYATDETPEYLPPAISFAHRLTRQLTKVRKDGTLPYLRPDGKSQVTVEFGEDGQTVKRIHTIVISTQHAEEVSLEQIRKEILPTDIQVALTHTPLTREYVADLVSWGGKEDTFSMRYASLILAGHYNGGQWRLPFVGAVHVPELGWFPEDSKIVGLSTVNGIPQYISPGLGTSAAAGLPPIRLFNTPTVTLITLTSKLTQ